MSPDTNKHSKSLSLSLSLSLSDYLEEPGQSGVPVGDVLGAAVHQGGDDVAEGGQGEVDLGGLLQSVPGRLSLALPLTASKVNQVEFSLEIYQSVPVSEE